MHTTSDSLMARVKTSIVEDIIDSLNDFQKTNVISRKNLQTFVGRVNHAAGLIITIRPFMQALWAALNSESSAPHQCIWKAQISHALGWLFAFFCHKKSGITRTFFLEDFNCQVDCVEFGTDASPWGLGGWISVNGVIQYYFSDPITTDDTQMFGIDTGHSEGQQLWEALAILVAIRLWAAEHPTKRIILSVKSDNVGALTLMLKMRPATPQMAIIGREIALCLAELAFPQRVTHTPGISHIVADMLSRVHQPGCTDNISHPALVDARRLYPDSRTKDWYLALGNYV